MVMEEPRDFADLDGVQLRDGLVASYADVKAMGPDQQLVDNRPKPNFDAGNIPNSINLPFNMLLDPETGYIKDEAGVRKAMEECGVDLTKPTTFSCGAGVLSTMGLIAAQGIIANTRMYDGSFSCWSSHSA